MRVWLVMRRLMNGFMSPKDIQIEKGPLTVQETVSDHTVFQLADLTQR